MLTVRRALKDILAGSAFVAFGVAFAGVAATYDVGTTLAMGPGYFPLVLGGILVILGLLIIAKGLVASEGEPIGAIPWRAALLIIAAVVFFGVTVRGLGLVPSLFVTVALSGFAGRRTGVVIPLVIAAGLTIVSVAIFVVALQLRLPLFGTWLGL